MPGEVPKQDYYPSWKMRLTVRFDEFGDKSRLQPAPKKATKNLAGVKDERGDLHVVADPKQAGAFLLVPKGQQAGDTTQPMGSAAASADGLTFDVVVIPTEFNVEHNGIRAADTMTCTFRYVDAPIDPRLVRACSVQFFAGCVTAEDYAAGIAGKSRATSAGGQEALNLIPDEWTDAAGNLRSNKRFEGWVDKWTVEWSEEGEPTVRLECRDNTQPLIEQEVPSKLVLDMKKPIDEAVAQYLAHFPQFYGLSVAYRPSTGERPVLEKVLAKTAYRPNLGPPASKGGGGSSKLAVWDYLTDVCRSVGHAVFVEGTTVVIQPVRSLMSNASVRRLDDPFKGRDLAGGVRFDYRRFIYGRNVKSMRISRNYSKKAPTNIEVRSFSAGQKTLLAERFPMKEDRQTYALPGDGGTDQKWTVINISGITDKKALRAVAQSYYEAVGRNELEIEVVTKNLGSYGGGNLDPDILDMRFGDTFELLVAREDAERSTAGRIETLLALQRDASTLLTRRGFSQEFADAYAKAYADAGFQPTFRLKQLKMSGQVDDGIELTLTGCNYIEIRADKLLPQGEEPVPAGEAAAPDTVNGSPFIVPFVEPG